MKKKSLLIASLLAAVMPYGAMAQRLQQRLERSVVAVCNSSTVNVTWRKLAQDPDTTTYNIYTRANGGSYTLLNSTPISKTNYQTTTAKTPYGSEIAVTTIVGGKESEKSLPFTLKQQPWKDLFFNFDFEKTILDPSLYKCKYAWPMDIDGTGRMDAVLVDRLSTDGSSHKLQAYRLDGTCLWTIDMGPNIEISGGQNDNVTVYDINCDGKCEVIIKTSDGTRFWDQQAGTWGKYANHSDKADTDGDGVVDYKPSATQNPPYYVSVVNGATGEEIDCAELKYSEITDGDDKYSRTGRANYKNDSDGKEYAFLTGKFVIAYFDGIHPSLGVETYDRTNDGNHHYYMCAWQYDWNGGTPSNFHHATTWARNGKSPYPAEFHQLRVADTDGDGMDAVLEGGFGWHADKGMVYSAGIGHGDRFDVSDIDPDRPGMEVFAIQQSSLLGQVLYDAKTGEHIKEWNLSSVYDVGRGRCMDVDASHKGMEMFSLLGGLYDCKGNEISSSSTYPNEAIWWDGDLQRELIGSPGGSGYGTNVIVQKYDGTRHINFSSESSWAVHSGWANRPAFVGDMTGDWREEIILMKQNAETSTGLVGYSTDIATNYSMYTLQEDPHYRLDMTGRGYYQSPCTSFYLGGDMPTAPLPPTMVTDLRWKNGTQWGTSTAFLAYDMNSQAQYADGKSVIFDISGDNSSTINISGQLQPGNVYLMAPDGHDYTFGGSGYIAGKGNITKSMLGTVTIGNNISTEGTITVSEGTLCLNGNVASDVKLMAKGTLAGTGTMNGLMTFEGALNYEGCRLKPTGTQGVMTFGKSLTLPGNVYIELDMDNASVGKISVKGDLTFNGNNIFTINKQNIQPGTYTLAECSGTLTADVTKLTTRGLDAVNYDFVVDGNKLNLVINDSRKALDDVKWTGATDTAWDYKTSNFTASATGATSFVNGDAVTFDDTATKRTVKVNDLVQPKSVIFNVGSGSYTFSGTGGISGTTGIEKRGDGEVKLNMTTSDYTGPTKIYAGTLTVPSLDKGGNASALGAAAATGGNLVLAGGTLKVTGKNIATDRQITVTDTSTVCVSTSGGSLTLSGKVSGSGYLVKTGNGQLNFSYGGSNNFAGLIVKAGVVSQGAWNSTFGASGSPMRLEGGEIRLIENKNSSTRPIFNYVATVPAGAKAQVTNVYRSAINGKFLGEGQLTIVSDGVRGDVGADFSGFKGTLIAQGSNVRLMDNVTDMSGTALQLAAAAYVGHYASNGSDAKAVTTKVGSLASTATDCTLGNGIDTYSIGHDNTSTTYLGLLKAATIQKYGDGTLTLKTNGNTSAITIYKGEVLLRNGSATAITSGTITVGNGGTLRGLGGCAGNVTVNSGGTLAAGSATSTSTLYIKGNVKIYKGSTLKVKVKGTNSVMSDAFNFTNNVAHANDTILVEVNETTPLENGTEVTIFKGTGLHTGTYILKTVSPGRIIKWDDSQLISTGKLKVESTTPTGISSVEAITPDTMVDVYTPSGIAIRRNVRRAEALNGLPQDMYVIKIHK